MDLKPTGKRSRVICFEMNVDLRTSPILFLSCRHLRYSRTMANWTLNRGESISRKLLHSQFGGGRQGGISPSRTSPNIFLFSQPEAALLHGYRDRWSGLVFLYVGEGKQGDQEMKRGNKAIRDHQKDGRALRLFRGSGGEVIYEGEYRLDPETPWDYEIAPNSGDVGSRRVIVFRLVPIN